MIGFVKGTIQNYGEGVTVVMTEGGVGYVISSSDTFTEGEAVGLHVVTVVREDAINLFAFKSASDAAIYRQVTRISGVGPQMGLNLLRELGGPVAVTAIATGDTGVLTSVSGIGPSVAKKIVANANFPAEFSSQFEQVVEDGVPFAELRVALVELGYDPEHVGEALGTVDPSFSDEEAMKSALSVLRTMS